MFKDCFCHAALGLSKSQKKVVKSIQCPILCNYAGADMGITESDINLLKQTSRFIQALRMHSSTTQEKVTDPTLRETLGKRTLRFLNDYLQR